MPERTLDDELYAMELAAANGSLEVRATGTTTLCPICNERVGVLEDRVEILTSSGKASTWRQRFPATHSKACHEEQARRIAKAVAESELDLWAR